MDTDNGTFTDYRILCVLFGNEIWTETAVTAAFFWKLNKTTKLKKNNYKNLDAKCDALLFEPS